MKTKKKDVKSKSMFYEIRRRFFRNKVATAALILLVFIILVAVFADVIVDYEYALKQDIPSRLQGPSADHWFGTDSFGRDVFARIVHGTRITLLLGLTAMVATITVAGVIGSIAAYYGGRIDNVIMRFIDVLMCIPPVLLVLSIVTSLGASITTLIVAIGVGQIAAFTRVIRSVILNIKGADFLEAARACGAKDWRIILRHIIPNAIGPVIVQGTMNVATVIIFAASISFIGMGVQPPQPEWGVMLGETKDYMRINPLLTIIPGLAIVFTSLSFNLFGDGLRDALDPRLKD